MTSILAVVLAGLMSHWLRRFAVLAASCAAGEDRDYAGEASASARRDLLIVTQNQGYFRKRNLDVQLVLMPSAPIAFSALTAGESHFSLRHDIRYEPRRCPERPRRRLRRWFYQQACRRLRGEQRHQDAQRPQRQTDRRRTASAAATGCSPCSRSTIGASIPSAITLRFCIIGNTGVRAQSIASSGSSAGIGVRITPSRPTCAATAIRFLADLGDLNIPFAGYRTLHAQEFCRPAPGSRRERAARAAATASTFIQSPDNKSAVLKSLVQWLRLSKTEGCGRRL